MEVPFTKMELLHRNKFDCFGEEIVIFILEILSLKCLLGIHVGYEYHVLRHVFPLQHGC